MYTKNSVNSAKMAVFRPLFRFLSLSAIKAVKNDGWMEYDVANVVKYEICFTPILLIVSSALWFGLECDVRKWTRNKIMNTIINIRRENPAYFSWCISFFKTKYSIQTARIVCVNHLEDQNGMPEVFIFSISPPATSPKTIKKITTKPSCPTAIIELMKNEWMNLFSN